MPVKYRGRTTNHAWIVVVVKRTPHVTHFRPVTGPGRSKTKIFKLINAVFDRDFVRVSGG
jgi:hypothetical protein